jgi:hypothetical protein
MRRDPDALFAARPSKKKVPFDFVLEELADLSPRTRPMFTGTAVYIGERKQFGRPTGLVGRRAACVLGQRPS